MENGQLSWNEFRQVRRVIWTRSYSCDGSTINFQFTSSKYQHIIAQKQSFVYVCCFQGALSMPFKESCRQNVPVSTATKETATSGTAVGKFGWIGQPVFRNFHYCELRFIRLILFRKSIRNQTGRKYRGEFCFVTWKMIFFGGSLRFMMFRTAKHHFLRNMVHLLPRKSLQMTVVLQRAENQE